MESYDIFQVDVISKEKIKPNSPTPHTLKTHKLSIFDQLMPQFHVPMVFFYSKNHQNGSDDVSERRNLLKQSLSKTLADFFPLAGEFKDNLHIDCNDHGVYYVETKVNVQLSDFLTKPDYKLIKLLHPRDASSMGMDPWERPHIIFVQVNIFSCGGIAIGISASHKIVDGSTYMTFMKAWAATARGDPQKVRPSFVSPLNFLQDPGLEDPTKAYLLRRPLAMEDKFIMKRFVFDVPAIVKLKAQAAITIPLERSPSRVIAVTSLLWKCAMAASRARHGSDKLSTLLMSVNLRPRSSPPFPQECVGNMHLNAVAMCTMKEEVELKSISGLLENALSEISTEFVNGLKGEEGTAKVLEQRKNSRKKIGSDYYIVSSWCNFGVYEADFGWGKPIWSCSPDTSEVFPTNLIMLLDSVSGGIEACVTLNELDMANFEGNPELLSFASVNPSTLNY